MRTNINTTTQSSMMKNTKDKVMGAMMRLKNKWMEGHAKRQKEFDEGYSMGIREVGWNPFNKKK